MRQSEGSLGILTLSSLFTGLPGEELSLNWRKDLLFSEKEERVKKDVDVIVHECDDGQGKWGSSWPMTSIFFVSQETKLPGERKFWCRED